MGNLLFGGLDHGGDRDSSGKMRWRMCGLEEDIRGLMFHEPSFWAL